MTAVYSKNISYKKADTIVSAFFCGIDHRRRPMLDIRFYFDISFAILFAKSTGFSGMMPSMMRA